MATRNEDIILRNLKRKYEGTSQQKKLQEEKEKEDMNFFEHFVATTGSIYNAIEKGAIKGAEGILDLGTGLLSGAGNLMGIDTTELDKFTATDLTQKLYDSEFKQYLDQYLKPVATANIPQIINNYGSSALKLIQGKNPFELNKVVKATNSGEYLPSIVQQVGETVGNMLVIAGTAGVGGGAGAKIGGTIGTKVGQFLGTMTATSGGGIEQALQEGGNIGEALSYGLGQGAVEATSEAFLSWGIGKAVKGVSKTISKVAPKLSSALSKAGSTISKGKIAGILGKSGTGNTLVRFAKNFGEEGMEEVFSSALDPVLQKLTYNKDKSIQEIFEANGGVENLVESFLLGGFMGGAFEGVSTIGGALRTGSLKNYNLEIEYGNLVEIDEQMKQIFKQEENERNNRKLGKLELQREEQIQKIQDKFGEYINDQILQNQADPNYKSTRTNYVKNLKAEMDYLTKTDYRVRALQDVVGQYTLVSETNEGASYSTKSGMEIKISKPQLERIKKGEITIREVLAHEVAHQFITDKVLNDKIISNEELMKKVYKKNKVSDLDELYYKKQSEGYNDNMVRTSKEYSDYIEQGLSKEEAFERAKRDYLNEEIVADVLFGNYYKSLNEIQQLIQGREEKGLKRLLSTIRRKYGNKEANARPKDYNEIIALIKSNIASNKERYTKQLKEKLEENVKKKTDKKYKLDSQGNELTEEQIEFYKDSKVRDKNGSLQVVYHGSRNKGFTEFDINRAGESGIPERAFFFTDQERVAKQFLFDEDGEIRPFYLNMVKPLNLNELSEKDIENIANMDKLKVPKEEVKKWIKEYISAGNFYALKHYVDYSKLADYGYDGAIVKWNVGENPAFEYAVIDSNQIKSIDNKKPTKSSDIRYKLDEMTTNDNELSLEEKMREKASDVRFKLDDLEPNKQKLFEETKDGYLWRQSINSNEWYKAKIGDVFNLDFYNDSYNRILGKEGQRYINALSTGAGHYSYIDYDNEMKVLQPIDVWKLQGFTTGDFDKIKDKVSASAIYTATGNSMTKQVMEAVLKQLNLPKNVKLIEYFGGIGASRMALRDMGHNVETLDYREINKQSKNIYNLIFDENFGIKDIRVKNSVNETADVLIHGSPCVDFSNQKINRKGGLPGSETESALMWETISRLYEMKSTGNLPKCVIWENVANVQTKKYEQEFNLYLSEMEKLGYHNNYDVLNSINYGIPQTRKRSFVVSTLENVDYEFDKGNISNTPNFVDFINDNTNVTKTEKNDIRYKLDEIDTNTEKRKKRLLDRIGRVEQYLGNPSVYEAYKTIVEYINQLDSISAQDNLELGRTLAKYEKAFKEGKSLEEETTIQPKETTKVEPKETELSKEEIESQEAKEIKNKNENISNKIIDNSKKASEIYQGAKNNSLDKQLEALEQLIILRENTIKLYDKYKKAFEGNKSGPAISAIEDLGAYIYIDLNESQADRTIEYKIENIEKSILEKQLKPKSEKKINIQETQKVEKIIKNVRTLVKIDSAETVILRANMKNDKIYRKERAKDLFALINSSFERNKRNNFRLRFNKGYELAQNRVFEVLNSTKYNETQKADIIRDIILEGVEVKALDYDPDTLMSRGRKVYTPINAWNVDEKLRANVYTKLDGMIKGILTIGGEPSELAKRVQKIAENYEKTNERLNTQLDTQIEENKKLLEEIKKQKESLNEMKTKDKASQKEIDKMIKKLERAEINYSILSKTKGSIINQLKDKNANLSRTITELKGEIKSLKAKLRTTTSRLAKAQSQAYGKKTLPKNFRNDIIEPIKSIDENFDLTNEQYLKFADLFSKGKIQESFDLYMEAIGEVNLSDNTKINELKGTSLYSEISTDIREYLESVYNNAEASINQKLKNKLANVKKFYREQLEIERAIKTITNKSKNLAKKVKNKQPGIVPQIATQIQGLVDIFTKVSKTSLMNGSIRTRLAEFLNVYKGINPGEINGAMLPEFVVDTIEDISSIDPSEKLTMEELKQYKDIVNAISKYINTASGDIEYDIDGNGQKVKIKDASKQGITQQKTIREKIKSGWRKIWSFVTPRLVFEGIDEYQDNGIYSRLFKMLQRGELKFQENYLDLIKPFIEFEKKNKSFIKSLNKKVEIGKFKGTKAQALYIYLLAQDIDGYQHMMYSGIQVEKGQGIDFKKEEIIENVLDEKGNQVLYQKGKNKGKPKTTTRYESAELDQFIKNLETELNINDSIMQKYIEITQEFFDNKARKLKYDTDIELYSVSNVKNAGEHYVPIRVSNLDINKNLDDKTFNTNDLQSVLNYRFNKNRTANLGKVSVQGINELVYSHARMVAQYSGYAVPINALNQTYNYRNENGESLGSITKERLGSEKNSYYLDDYINGLLRDWQGIKGSKTMLNAKINSFIGSLRGKFAKYQLGFNLKVIFSQLSSLPASLRYIDTKNLIGANKLRMKNLPPIPALAEYRKLDNSVAQAQTMTLVGKANKGLDKIADAGSKGITWMDTKVMNQLWKASLLQTRNADGSWNIEKATELFNKTATETQPMYNALERSALQRTDNEVAKTLLMFTAQPLQNLSILIEIGARARARHRMGQKLTKQEKTLARKSIMALLSQGAMYTAITMLFKYLLDKDDKPEDAMDWVVQYVNDNIIGMIPLVNSISLNIDENGISFDRNDFELSWLTQFNDAINSLGDVTDSSLTLEKRLKSFTESFGMFTGIPTRNLYNYTIGLAKQWIEPVYEFDAKWSGNINSKTSINNALDKGSNKKSKAYFNAYNKNILDLNENTLNALYELYKEDRSSALKSIPSTFTLENEIIPVDQVKFKQTYSKVEKQLNVVNLGVFKRSKVETKEYVVSKLINTYYNLAKKEQLGQELNKFELLATTSFDLGRNLIYLGEIEKIEATTKKTRKQLVEQYINRLPLQASMKYVLFALAGYSIPDSKKQSVKLLLRRYGMKTKHIEQFLD